MSGDTINELYAKLVEAINSSKEEIKLHIEEENKKILDSVKQQEKRIEEIEKRFSEFEEKQLQFERYMRKNNIVVFGLDPELAANKSLLEQVLNFLNTKLELDIKEQEINNVTTFDTKQEEGNTAIKIEFVTYIRKHSILKKAYKLKGTKIFIAQDLCYRDRQDRKVLVEHLKLAKQKQYSAKIVGYNKLVINGDIYTVSQLQHMNLQEPPKKNPMINSAPSTPSEQTYGTSFDIFNTETKQLDNTTKEKDSFSEKEKRKRNTIVRGELPASSKKLKIGSSGDNMSTKSKTGTKNSQN